MNSRYRLNPGESRFTVQAFASGALSRFAHNPSFAVRQFSGQAQFDPDQPETASLIMTVKADSLDLIDDVSSKDRQEIEHQMREEVLETRTYPEIIFKSTEVSIDKIYENVYRTKINGDLTLHGVTKTENIEAQVRLMGENLRASGEFTLRQSDYRIRLVSAMAGAIKVKDELKFSFEIVAKKEGQS